jgi:hypothetical protein
MRKENVWQLLLVLLGSRFDECKSAAALEALCLGELKPFENLSVVGSEQPFRRGHSYEWR